MQPGNQGVTNSLPHETILEFDKKFHDIVLRFNAMFDNVGNILTIQQPSDHKGGNQSGVKIYGKIGHFCMDSRFARLHCPYLLRGAKDPRHECSRMTCRRSACSVIELGNAIMLSRKDLVTFKI